jgi:hypothetical protein
MTRDSPHSGSNLTIADRHHDLLLRLSGEMQMEYSEWTNEDLMSQDWSDHID